MTLQEILSANRELIINNYNSNIQLRNYTAMTLRDYILGVMAWFADHSGSARKVVANPESRYIVESFINKACAEVGGNAVKVLRRSSLNSPLNRFRVEINVIMPKDNGDTYDDLHTFTATSVEACRKLAASTAADFNAPARVAIYDGRVEIERYNIPSRWVIQDRETGTEIDYFDSYEEACAGLNRYEQDDMDNGVYTPDFYEIREK